MRTIQPLNEFINDVLYSKNKKNCAYLPQLEGRLHSPIKCVHRAAHVFQLAESPTATQLSMILSVRATPKHHTSNAWERAT